MDSLLAQRTKREMFGGKEWWFGALDLPVNDTSVKTSGGEFGDSSSSGSEGLD